MRNAWRWGAAAALIALVLQVRSSWVGVLAAGCLVGILLWPVLSEEGSPETGDERGPVRAPPRAAVFGGLSAAVLLLVLLVAK